MPVCEISCSSGLWEKIRVGVSWRFWRRIKIGLNFELESKTAPEASGCFYWLWTGISLDVDCKMWTLNELKLKLCTRARSLCKGCLMLISSLLVEVMWYTFLACVQPVMRLFYDCTCQLYLTCHLSTRSIAPRSFYYYLCLPLICLSMGHVLWNCILQDYIFSCFQMASNPETTLVCWGTCRVMLECFKLIISHRKLLHLLEAVAMALFLILASCLHACSVLVVF